MNLKRGFLALAAMILSVGFFGASQAQAQVSTIPVTRGGITCYKVVGGTYPEDGHMFRCSSVANYNNELQARPKNVMNGSWGTNSEPGLDMKERFAAAGVEFYVFDDAWQYKRFLDNVSSPTASQLSTWFNQFKDLRGYSVDPTQNPQRAVVVFKNYFISGTYPPGNSASQSMTDFSHTIVHEMGHNYDFLATDLTGGVYPSFSAEFNRVANLDRAYFLANDPNAGAHDFTAGYYFKYNSGNGTTPPDNHWAELFAEHAAKNIHGNAASDPAATADAVVNAYWVCTKRYVAFMMLWNRAPVAGTTDYNTARCR